MRPRRKGPEEEWQGQLTYLLDVLGWTWIHVPPSKAVTRRRSPDGERQLRTLTAIRGSAASGYPDLTCFAPTGGRVVFLEVKTDTGSLEPHQRERLADMDHRGLEAYVARPADLELIRAVLQRGRYDHGRHPALTLELVDLLRPWRWPNGRRPRGVAGDPRAG